MSPRHRRLFDRIAAVSFLALAAACSDGSDPRVETETHFLVTCEGACEGGLECICGVCTKACASESSCDGLADTASCVATPSACGSDVETACDLQCSELDDCDALGARYACVAGRCRELAADAGVMGGSGGTGTGGAGVSGTGGRSGEGGAGQGSGGVSGASATDAGADAGNVEGDAGVSSTDCNEIGETCCDPAPQDGPNYCASGRLMCGAGNACEANCECTLGAYFPVCGVDGQSYDATCGRECVSVEIACDGECPCESGSCAVECTGIAPDQEVVDACSAITDMAACTSYQSGGFPSNCRWITPSTGPCLVP